MPRNESWPNTQDHRTLLRRLALEDGAQVRSQHDRFYGAYGVPLENYLVRLNVRRKLPDAPDSLVHEFLAKHFWEPSSIDRLPAKYFRKVGAICIATLDRAITEDDVPSTCTDYLLKLAARELGGLSKRKWKQQQPDGLKVQLVKVGVEYIGQSQTVSQPEETHPSFRGYLLTAMYNFVCDQWAAKTKQLADNASPAEPPPAPGSEEEHQFALDSISGILDQTLYELAERFKHRVHWDIFTAYIADPARTGQPQPTMDEVALRYRDRIIANSAKDKPAEDWTDAEVAKGGRSVLDAFRREFWKQVEQYVNDFEMPENIHEAVRESIRSRRRNELLQTYFILQAKQPEQNTYAAYMSQWLNPDDDEGGPSDTELRKDWLSLLSGSLYELLAKRGHSAARQYKDLFEHQGEALRNLDQCLRHQQPPRDLLTHIKEAAKDRESPEAISKTLYLTSIAVAYLRTNEWISSMTCTDYCKLVSEVSSFPWLDKTTRCLLEECRMKIEGSCAGLSEEQKP